jgi:Methyltransferase domain
MRAGEVLNQLYAKMPDDIIFSGYEISEQAFQLATTREKSRLNFYLKDLIKEPQTFDIVLVIDVIEHVSDFYGFLEKIREKGVYKMFHIPLDLSVQTVMRSKPILNGRKQVGHINYFTKETALAALADSGYTIIDCMYTAGML